MRNWTPEDGEQARGVLKRSGLDNAACQSILDSAIEILGSGVNPSTGLGRSTGLVVGYVQSGKTLSFTTVIGLARDNGFPLVIVVAGNKTSLLAQSHKRLQNDLDVDGGDGLPDWIMAQNPKAQDSQYSQLITRAIENWHDDTREPDEKPTLVLTVLKQNHRLRSLTQLLSEMNLEGIPTLIIDDEADQASLNTKVNRGEESTTYTRLRELRDAVPCHLFLQYTATPQAPLLINIADVLSPDFIHVLEPGSGYVGGETFFAPNSAYVEIIPAGDVAMLNVGSNSPPDSLLYALRIYFVGLAASICKKTGRRSMLIHPARERVVHQESAEWAITARDAWLEALKSADADRADVIEDFRAAYDDLARTASDLPTFEAIEGRLQRALRNTMVIEFNTRGQPKTPDIHWRNSEGWILVGGQAVDRGLTVDSLSVTYMPRGTGVGNADSLQQRARFFGYKRAYLGVCRVYLEQDLFDAFESYVEHEQIMRAELGRLAASGTGLRDWRRRLVLDPSLQPCRRTVISDPFMRAIRAGGWTEQRGARLQPEALTHNAAIIDELVQAISLIPDTSYTSSLASQQHEVDPDVPLKRVVDALVGYTFEDPRDVAGFTGLLVVLGEVLRTDPNARAVVYRMRPKAVGTRTTLESGSFMQGRTRTAGGGYSYPGDGSFRAADRLTVQLHRFNLRSHKDGPIEAEAAPLLAFYVPDALAKSWLVQVQQGQSAAA